jgi:hypothetical protein
MVTTIMSVLAQGDPLCRLLNISFSAIQKPTGCIRAGLVIEGLEIARTHVKLIPNSKPSDLAQSNAKDATDHELKEMAEKIRRNPG